MLQIDELAVGKLGTIHGHWRARSINDAREQGRPAETVFGERGALSVLQRHAWQ